MATKTDGMPQRIVAFGWHSDHRASLEQIADLAGVEFYQISGEPGAGWYGKALDQILALYPDRVIFGMNFGMEEACRNMAILLEVQGIETFLRDDSIEFSCLPRTVTSFGLHEELLGDLRRPNVYGEGWSDRDPYLPAVWWVMDMDLEDRPGCWDQLTNAAMEAGMAYRERATLAERRRLLRSLVSIIDLDSTTLDILYRNDVTTVAQLVDLAINRRTDLEAMVLRNERIDVAEIDKILAWVLEKDLS